MTIFATRRYAQALACWKIVQARVTAYWTRVNLSANATQVIRAINARNAERTICYLREFVYLTSAAIPAATAMEPASTAMQNLSASAKKDILE